MQDSIKEFNKLIKIKKKIKLKNEKIEKNKKDSVLNKTKEKFIFSVCFFFIFGIIITFVSGLMFITQDDSLYQVGLIILAVLNIVFIDCIINIIKFRKFKPKEKKVYFDFAVKVIFKEEMTGAEYFSQNNKEDVYKLINYKEDYKKSRTKLIDKNKLRYIHLNKSKWTTEEKEVFYEMVKLIPVEKKTPEELIQTKLNINMIDNL